MGQDARFWHESQRERFLERYYPGDDWAEREQAYKAWKQLEGVKSAYETSQLELGKRVMECDELRQEVARLKRKCNRLVRKVGALSARVSESGNDDE
jgi:hypothetical protein